MRRLIFMIKNSFQQRNKIKAARQNKHQVEQVTHLNPHTLKTYGIKYIALDFDGVLAPYGRRSLLNDHIFIWLNNLCQYYGQKNVFILSNNPTTLRTEYFLKNFPEIRCIDDVEKKPYPDGLAKIQTIVNCQASELTLIDDRILTGYLACILAGSFPILVTKPYTDYLRRPCQEVFFSLLRFIEKSIFY